MAQEKFEENLMRMVAAEVHLLNCLNVSREMYAKSYFSLGVGERALVDQTMMQMLAATYQAITPQYLASQKTQQPMGFRVPAPEQP